MARTCKPAKGPGGFLKGGDCLSSCETVSAVTRIVCVESAGYIRTADSPYFPVLRSYKVQRPVVSMC